MAHKPRDIEPFTDPVHGKRLVNLSLEEPNCRGRFHRLTKALDVNTIGELLEWANRQNRGLEQITDHTNIGEKTLSALVSALRQEGIERIPKGPNDQ